MGNASAKELGGEGEGNNSLNISRKFTPEQYLQHVSGEFLEGCLLEVPWEIYYNTVSMYEEINASFNFISEIPEELSMHVPHLRVLQFSHNRIVSLPQSFNMLIHLEVLDLSYNRLKALPESLVGLRQLHTLNLANNNITELPATVSKMLNLNKLNLSHNNIRALPGGLAECPRLEVLVCLGNNLIHPPQAICDQGSQATLTFLRERHLPIVAPRPSVKLNVFARVRGQKLLVSVANPESASREYCQAQGTARTNKRKCPLMPPVSATTLTPDQLRNMLLGLVYGASIADAMALNTEALTGEECLFNYNPDTINLEDRVYDHLRLHYPPHDWSCSTDIMLLTLESLMRWGGVVDELELASQLDQWLVHGYVDLDPSPGHLLSPYMAQVITTEGYAASPHATAEAVHKHLKDEISRGIYNANPRDNSCLPQSLIMGIPNFFKKHEVKMNSERICHASHTDPLATAACTFLSLLISSLLQGKMTQEEASLTALVDEIKEEIMSSLNEIDTHTFAKAFVKNTFDEDDVTTTLSLLSTTLKSSSLKMKAHPNELDFKSEIIRVVMRGGRGACNHACVVGGVLGAILGYSQLPQDWLVELPQENIRLLNVKLNLLLDLFGLP